MIRLAVIGTNWITDSFIQGALACGEFSLVAVFSRSLETAQQFGAKYESELDYYDDFEAFCCAPDIDAVYVASPNSFHAPQSIALLKAGKHVICEKPLGSNLSEVQAMYQAARESGRVLFEAYKTAYLPNFVQIKKHLADIGPLHRGHFSYCQLSSRYGRYLAGENPNTFNPAFSNGSVMDIGYYCIAAALELFGEPESVMASGKLLDSGVDAHGSAIFSYEGFELVVSHSKVCDSSALSDILGEKGTLAIEFISEPARVLLQRKGEPDKDLTLETDPYSMRYEAEKFAEQIKAGAMSEQAVERSLATARVITEIRRRVGVVFPADKGDA